MSTVLLYNVYCSTVQYRREPKCHTGIGIILSVVSAARRMEEGSSLCGTGLNSPFANLMKQVNQKNLNRLAGWAVE